MEDLLKSVAMLVAEYDIEICASGSGFNLFNAIRQERKELMHSNFIAELLDLKINGERLFLKTFIEALGLLPLDISSTVIKREVYVGRKCSDPKKFGFIDLYLCDGNKNKVAIENKIDAGDQPAQLERYRNHIGEGGKLLYLTLYGTSPSNCNDHIEYKRISYKNEIYQWLNDCLKFALPVQIELNIKQYFEIIKQLTNQTDIIKFIMNDKLTSIENLKAAEQISKAYELKVEALKKSLLSSVNQQIGGYSENGQSKLLIYEMDGISIHWIGGVGKEDFYFVLTIDGEGDKEKYLKIAADLGYVRANDKNVLGVFGVAQDPKLKHSIETLFDNKKYIDEIVELAKSHRDQFKQNING